MVLVLTLTTSPLGQRQQKQLVRMCLSGGMEGPDPLPLLLQSYCKSVRTCTSRTICRRHDVLPDLACRGLSPFRIFSRWCNCELICNKSQMTKKLPIKYAYPKLLPIARDAITAVP